MDHITFRGENLQKQAIRRATEEGLAENESEATRLLINQGAADLGIVNGHGVQSQAERNRFKRVMQDMAEVGAYIGVAWGLVLTLYPHSTVNWLVIGPMLLALVLIVIKDLFVKHA